VFLLKPSVKIESPINHELLTLIEDAGRTCYKSEALHDKQYEEMLREAGIPEGEHCPDAHQKVSEAFIRRIIKSGHHSVLEHASMTVRFICDRGVSHELVRHRLAAFSQESTRYVNYGGGCQFIIPPWIKCFPLGEYHYWPLHEVDGSWDHVSAPEGSIDLAEMRSNDEMSPMVDWMEVMLEIESIYSSLLEKGWSPQQARSVLPNSTKTEVVMTANMREWRHVLTLRTSPAAHPQMREVMLMLLEQLKASPVAVLFEDINA